MKAMVGNDSKTLNMIAEEHVLKETQAFFLSP
jgi:hypothetical protein